MNMLRLATDVRRQVKMVKAEKRSKSCGCVRASLEAAGMWHTLSATGTYTGTLSQEPTAALVLQQSSLDLV